MNDIELKYIVTDKGSFAIFSKSSDHSEMARGLYGKPVGAGLCNFAVGYKTDKNSVEWQDVNIHCYGRSTTLKMESREEDEKIINRGINHGS